MFPLFRKPNCKPAHSCARLRVSPGLCFSLSLKGLPSSFVGCCCLVQRRPLKRPRLDPGLERPPTTPCQHPTHHPFQQPLPLQVPSSAGRVGAAACRLPPCLGLCRAAHQARGGPHGSCRRMADGPVGGDGGVRVGAAQWRRRGFVLKCQLPFGGDGCSRWSV